LCVCVCACVSVHLCCAVFSLNWRVRSPERRHCVVPGPERRHCERVSCRSGRHVGAEAPEHCAFYGCGDAPTATTRSCLSGYCRRLHDPTALRDCDRARLSWIAVGCHTGAADEVRITGLRAPCTLCAMCDGRFVRACTYCRFEWPLLVKMARDTACGMAFLHGARTPILHRDLKVRARMCGSHRGQRERHAAAAPPCRAGTCLSTRASLSRWSAVFVYVCVCVLWCVCVCVCVCVYICRTSVHTHHVPVCTRVMYSGL
jgi:hypothetical protein